MKGKKQEFLNALLTEPTIVDASRRAGISRSTAQRYLKSEDFKKELETARTNTVNDTVRFLQGKLSLCNETLINIINDPNVKPQIKINAINTVYTNVKQMIDTSELLGRVEQLESIIEKSLEEYE